MRTTIDRAGRLVVPKALRAEIGLVPGEVEIVVDGSYLRVEPVTAKPVRRNGRLMLPDGPPLSDDEVRELRLADQR